jgi:hypothetical protein
VVLTPRRVRAARLIAAIVDLSQIALLPTFLPASVAGANNVIDLVAAVVLIALAGWHWAFLPTFLIEMIPMAELAPTWSLAVYLATRGHGGEEEVTVTDVTPKPVALPPGDQAPRSSSGS